MTDNRRQELYDRIRGSSKQAVIIEEMKKLGFWPVHVDQPTVPEQLIARETELSKELRQLVFKRSQYQNQEQMLQIIRRERMQASRQKQKENKERRLREAKEKAARWQQRKRKELLYLGEGVSAGLNDKESKPELLAQNGLPLMHTALDLAHAMGVTLGELRFLAFNRKVHKISHYRRFYIRKKSGGKRLISAPLPRLKAAQRWIQHLLLNRVALHPAVHGFAPGRSIVSNALPHVGAEMVVNIDLKDFFPTVSYRRVKGVFRALGYSEQLATVMGLICTEPEVDRMQLDGQTWHIAKSARLLPQGAPSSPALTNIICKRMDSRLAGLTRKMGFAYTRYADDMSFSASGEATANLPKLLGTVRRILYSEGFHLHPDKLRIMRKGARKEVTGIVVNEKPAVSRPRLKKFRALLFQIERDGTEGKHWEGNANVMSAIHGFANFVRMVDEEKGMKLVHRVSELMDRYPLPATSFPSAKKKEPHFHEAPLERVEEVVDNSGLDSSNADKRPWWKFW